MDIQVLLQQYRQGSTKEFDVLTSKLKDPRTESEQLVMILKGLKSCVSQLGNEVEVLVGVLLQMDWVSKEPAVVQEYQVLILNIVSAQPSYLNTLLKSLIRQFIPSKDALSSTSPTILEKVRAKHEAVFVRVHTVLNAVLKIVPMAVTILPRLLSDLFPYVGHEPYILASYARNLLQIVHYQPHLRLSMLELLVDRMVKIDVRASRESIQDAENGVEEDLGIFEMDTDISPETQPTRPMAHPDAHRLDTLMELILHYIRNICYPKGEDLDWEATKGLYRDLLHIFERTILPTHQSCHVQFIMFYICSFKMALVEGFSDYLLKKIQDPNVQQIYRQAAVAYLASFLARAKYIQVQTFRNTIDVVVQWIRRYIKHTSQSDAPLDVVHHAPFYAVCQGLFYVFVFRHKELVQTPEGYKYCESLNLQSIVTCRLNPLRFCMPVIVKTFSSVTRQHQLAFCDTIIEKNNRCRLPVATHSHDKVACQGAVAAYFPFDPYLLSKSGRFIAELYREYDGTIVHDALDEDLAEEQHDDDEECDEEPSLPRDLSLGKSPIDFLYPISPGFKMQL